MDARWTDRNHVARATRHFSTLQFRCQPPCQPSVSSPFKRALFLLEQTPEQTLSVLKAGAPNAGSSALGAPSETVQRAAICAPGGLEWRQAVHLQDNPVRVPAAYGSDPPRSWLVGHRYRPALGRFTRSGGWGGST